MKIAVDEEGAVARRFVTIAMPALNEERYIAEAISSIAPRSEGLDWELLVLDGGSSDRTASVVAGIAANEPRVRLLANDRRIQASAVNLAARVADPRAEILVRADCHAAYPKDFVERCVARLTDQDSASVVVPMRAEGRGCIQAAIAAAQNSRLGNGGSPHRMGEWSGYVDHGHHAAFDRRAFLALGGYDERFTHNEDAEFDTRMVASGRRIYLDGGLGISYFPRASFGALARQYFAYGRGRARTVLKHRITPRLRQLLPVGVLLGCLGAFLAAPLDVRLLALPLLYALACLAWGAVLALRERQLCAVLSGVAAIVMHLAWGAGFLAEIAAAKAGMTPFGWRSHEALSAGDRGLPLSDEAPPSAVVATSRTALDTSPIGEGSRPGRWV